MRELIGIIDYGIGNLQSVVNAVEKLSLNYKIINNAKEIKKFDKIILIGVGSFSSCMESLEKNKFSHEIKKFVKRDGFLLGICVGMQVLMEIGTENKRIKGLGFVKGEVNIMKNSNQDPLPHIGWNEISKIDMALNFLMELKKIQIFIFTLYGKS